ncbi:hypothetical protein GM547_13470 [Streptococcus pneumoniae]|nr:hypothetical protein [Streptococcus pneumoniae]
MRSDCERPLTPELVRSNVSEHPYAYLAYVLASRWLHQAARGEVPSGDIEDVDIEEEYHTCHRKPR